VRVAGDVILVGALVKDIAARRRARDARRIAVFVAVLESHGNADPVRVAHNVVPAPNGLVRMVSAAVGGVDKILLETGEIGRREISEGLLGDGADPAGGDHVAGKWVANIAAISRDAGRAVGGNTGPYAERIIH